MKSHNRKVVIFWLAITVITITILFVIQWNKSVEDFTKVITEFPIEDCLVGIDVVYYINLEHRKDRKVHIESELRKMGVPETKVIRVDAVLNTTFGGLGCCASHIKAYELFQKSPHTKCLILEDDFMFTQSPYDVRHFFTSIQDISYDVCMLSANELIPTFSVSERLVNTPSLRKVYDAQTASAYCLNKSFAQTLRETVQEGYDLLSENLSMKYVYMNDMYWKRLQPSSSWYIATPVLGVQRESYSDIENTTVRYGV